LLLEWKSTEKSGIVTLLNMLSYKCILNMGIGIEFRIKLLH